MMRLFVALDLPDLHKQQLASLCCGVPGMKWVDPQGLHLTLRFLGEVTSDVAEEVDLALSHLKVPEFTLNLCGFGTFGGRHPEHLWVGVQPNAALSNLAERIEQAAQQSGLPADPRRFTPHVTLGHGRQLQPLHIQEFYLRHEPFSLPAIPVQDFHLFQSHLTRNGPFYQSVVRYPLHSAHGLPLV